MMEIQEQIQLEGCNFFRQHIIFSLLSGRPIKISQIRPYDDAPGIKTYEYTFITMIEQLTNGTKISINKSGTEICFEPGVIIGGNLEMECGTERCISYFLESLVFIAPFCKNFLNVRLKGITNSPYELSVDEINAAWLPIFSRFVLADEGAKIKINARGFLPDGGGMITFTSPIKQKLRAVQSVKSGKIQKIRGLAYICKVSPSIASRMIEGAKKMLHGYIADIYITIDQRKGPQGGMSPGFGIFLVAETTEGIFYNGEAMSMPKDSEHDQTIPEEVGECAAKHLLDEIYKGGCTNSSAQALAASFMALCDKDVSKYLFGPLNLYCVHTLRNLRLFFNHAFKLEELWKIPEFEKEKQLRTGSDDKCMLTCVGIGYYNINKTLM